MCILSFHSSFKDYEFEMGMILVVIITVNVLLYLWPPQKIGLIQCRVTWNYKT
jgi:hypothetical protein